MSPEAVRTRRDLEEYVGQALLDEYYFREEGEIVRQVSTFLKTYLLEIHPRQLDPVEVIAGSGVGELRETAEQSLWHLVDSKGESYFFDFLEPRYPLLHTIAPTGSSDPLVARLANSAQVDYCWFPSDWLRHSLEGQVFGFRLFFQHGLQGLEESSEAEALRKELGRDAPPAFRLRLSDFIGAESDLESLTTSTQFGSQAALDSLAWRFWDESGLFIHDEVWHNGKVTAYGTSWDKHLDSMLSLQLSYGNLVRQIEEETSLTTRSGRLSGSPFSVRLASSPIVDVEAFAMSIVDPRSPVRLSGLADQLNEGAWYVEAVDLHTNDRVSLDISADSIRAYIRDGACGNVLPRLLVHIERHVGARTHSPINVDYQ